MRLSCAIITALLIVAAPLHAFARQDAPHGVSILTKKGDGSLHEKEAEARPTVFRDITLARALSLVMKSNPSLAALAEEIRAKEAAALQAGLLPNPAVGLEMENFAGKDQLRGFDGAETTLFLSQLFELGEKRQKRRRVGDLEKDLAGWDYRSREQDMLAGTAKAFVEVLAAQLRLALNKRLVQISQQTLDTVSARVAAGKVRPIEQTRARVELASTKTNFNRSERELQAARVRLASFWGGEVRAQFQKAVGDLGKMATPPSQQDVLGQLAHNPDLARWDNELQRRKARLALAKSRAVPDLTLSFGLRNFQETKSNAPVAGIELPLPLFDRNQGGIGQAMAELAKARRQKQETFIRIRSRLLEVRQRLVAAFNEAVALREEILPGAQRAFEATEIGYREGKYGFLQLLDAQRTLFKVQGQYLTALSSYHIERIQLERLAGDPLRNIMNSGSDWKKASRQ